MKRLIFSIIAVLILAAMAYCYLDMAGFANGVNNDVRRRNEIFKNKGESLDTVHYSIRDSPFIK